MKCKIPIIMSLIFAFLIISGANAEQTLQLREGWNLIGITEKASNMKVSDLIDKNSIDLIVTNENGAWKKFDPDKSYLQQFKEFKAGQGYWVKANNSTTIKIYGIEKSTIPQMRAGWNLVAFSSATQVSNLINSLQQSGYKLELIVTNENGAWKKFDPDKSYLQQFAVLNTNLGYWVKTLKALETTEIGNSGKKVVAYVDKDLTDQSKVTPVNLTIGNGDNAESVTINVPEGATKVDIRIVNEYGEEIKGGIVLDENDIQNGSYAINDVDLNEIQSVAYYVLSANPAGVPQPLSDVVVKDAEGNELGTTDPNGIVSIDVDDGTTLVFEKDGYSVYSTEFFRDRSVKYIFLSPANELSGDELNCEDEGPQGADRILNRVTSLKKFYAVKSATGENTGIVEVLNFSVDHNNFGSAKFRFSPLGGSTSFDGLDKLKRQYLKEYEDNATKWVPKVITGMQISVYDKGVRQQGDKTYFDYIDKGANVQSKFIFTKMYDQPDLIKTALDRGAILRFYAYDGEKWIELTNGTMSLTNSTHDLTATPLTYEFGLIKDLNDTLGKLNVKRLKKYGFTEDDYVALLQNAPGFQTIVGVIWNKEDSVVRKSNIQVKVREEDGVSPIKNANVKILDQVATTDENGTAYFDEIVIPKGLINLTIEVTEPNHYRNITRRRVSQLQDGDIINLTMERPAEYGTINVTTVDTEGYPVSKAMVDIITPAVLSDVSYKDGVISVGLESTAEYCWYIKPNTDDSAGPGRVYRPLRNNKLYKLATDSWTELKCATGTNSITVSDIMKKLIEETDPAVGSLKIGVYVKHKNGLEDGNATDPIVIGEADILFNKELLEKMGLEKHVDSNNDAISYWKEENSTLEKGSVSISGRADLENPYITVSVPQTAVKDTLNIKWYGVFVYENEEGKAYYWNGSKWTDWDDTIAEDEQDLITYLKDTVIKDLEGAGISPISSNSNYLTFSELAEYLTNPQMLKALFVKEYDGANWDGSTLADYGEETVLDGTVRLYVVPQVTFKNKHEGQISDEEYWLVASTQLEHVVNVLSVKDIAVKPASILPHHIYSKTNDDGMLRVVNVPLTFGNNGEDKSFLDIRASKAGYLDSQRKTVPGFTKDDPTTPEFEDVASVSLSLEKRGRGNVIFRIKDENNATITGAKVIIPSATTDGEQVIPAVAVDNGDGDENSAEGEISLSNIFVGGYSATVFKDGYKPAVKPVIIKKGETVTVDVTLEPLSSGVALISPRVDDLIFSQSGEFLTVQGKVVDTEDGTYSNASSVTLFFNDKSIDITPESSGDFTKSLKLERGVNFVQLYVANAKGKFETTTKSFIYIGETAYFHGKVTDKQSGTGLADVILEITTGNGDTIYRTTDSDGKYEVSDMPLGSGIINAVYVDDNGYIFSTSKKYAITSGQKEVVVNVVIDTQNSASISEPAEVYVDRYNGADDMPDEVSTDSLKLEGRVVNYDKQNGNIRIDVTYSDGTSTSMNVANDNLVSQSQNENTYIFKVNVPLKDGDNYIFVSAENPVYGGATLNFIAHKIEPENVQVISLQALITDTSGLPVYANVAVSKLDGSPIGVFGADEEEVMTHNGENATVAIATVTGLIPERFYIFELTAPGYGTLKQVKKVTADTKSLWFVMTSTESDMSNGQPTNSAPQVSLDYNNNDQYYEFTANAYDPDGDPLTYKWLIDQNSVTDCKDSAYCSYEFESEGNHTVSVTVSDGTHNATATKTISVINSTNNPPQIQSSETSVTLQVGDSKEVQLTASDPDGDVVNITVKSSDESIATATYDDNSGIITITGIGEGTATITITADDNNGGTDEATITVNVESSGNEGIEYPPSPGGDSGLDYPPSPGN